MVSPLYVDGITNTVPHNIASSLTANQTAAGEDTISIWVVCPDRWFFGDFAVVTSRDGLAFAGEVEGIDVCTGEITIRGGGQLSARATPIRSPRLRSALGLFAGGTGMVARCPACASRASRVTASVQASGATEAGWPAALTCSGSEPSLVRCATSQASTADAWPCCPVAASNSAKNAAQKMSLSGTGRMVPAPPCARRSPGPNGPGCHVPSDATWSSSQRAGSRRRWRPARRCGAGARRPAWPAPGAGPRRSR